MATIPDPEFLTGCGRYDRPQRHFTVPTKRCCGLLAGDDCDCAEFAAQFEASPAVVFTAGTWRTES